MKNTKVLALVKKAKSHNRQAFAKLCELKVNEVIYLCIQEMGNPADGQDAAQEVFIQMQKSLPSLQEPEAFNVWLNRLIHNTCVSMKRKNMRHSGQLGTEAFEDFCMDETLVALPQDYVEEAEKRQKILAIIDDLPEKYRRCVTLHYFQNLTYAEIAQVLDIDKDAVNNNMRMARKYIKERLEADEPGRSYAGAFSVVVGPLIAQSLSEAAQSTVSIAAAQQCLAAAGVSTAAIAAGAGAGAGLAGGLAVKATAAVMAVAVVTGTGVYVANHTAPSVPEGISGYEQLGEVYPLGAGSALEGRIYLALPEDASSLAYNGLAGVELALVSADDPDMVLQTFTTEGGEANGRFVLEDIPEGRYRLRFTLPPGAELTRDSPSALSGTGADAYYWLELEEETELALDGAARLDGLDIELTLPARVTGRLQFSFGGAAIEFKEGLLPGVCMELYDPQGELLATASITEQGEYEFINPMLAQDGAYLLKAAAQEDAAVTVNIPDLEIELHPGYTS